MGAFADWFYSVPLSQLAGWAGAAAAVLVAMWKGGPKAWRAFKRLVGLLSASIKLVDTLATLPDDLAAIRHELEHNGGGSVKDSVVRTEQAIAELSRKVEHVQRQGASLKTTLAKTSRRLDDHIASRSNESV